MKINLSSKPLVSKATNSIILSKEHCTYYPKWEQQTIRRIDGLCPTIQHFGLVFFGKINLLETTIAGIDIDNDDLLFGPSNTTKSTTAKHNMTTRSQIKKAMQNNSKKEEKDSAETEALSAKAEENKRKRIKELVTVDILQKVYETVSTHLDANLQAKFTKMVKGELGFNPVSVPNLVKGLESLRDTCGYEPSQLYNLVEKRLKDVRQSKGQSLKEYVDDFMELWEDMQAAEHEMIEMNFVRKAINGLPNSLSIRNNLVLQSLDKNNCPTLDDLKMTLETYHHSVFGNTEGEEIALAAREAPHIRRTDDRVYCKICKFNARKAHSPGCIQCNTCGYWGHIAKYCSLEKIEQCKQKQGTTRLSTGQRPGTPTDSNNNSSTAGTSDPMKLVRALLSQLNLSEEQVLQLVNKEKISAYLSALATDNFQRALTTPIMNDPHVSDPNVWVIDSGCTKSISRVPLDRHEKTGHADYYQNANGSIMKTSGITGDIELSVNTITGSRTLVLSNTSYVPDSAYNLLSIPHLCKKGFLVLFFGNNCYIFDNSLNLITTALRLNDLYCLIDNSRCTQFSNLTRGSPKMTPQLLHERFGHVNMDSLKRLIDNDAAIGIPTLETDSSFTNLKCDSCLRGKAHAQPFPHSQTTYLPLECINVDIHFPGERSLAGHTGSVTITDRYSSYATSIPIKSRSELREIMTKWVNWAERQANVGTQSTTYRIKMIRLDNAKEGLHSIFTKLCSDLGISLDTSLPYTSEQNGAVERKHYTVMNLTRTVLCRSNAPTNLWHEALVAVTHTNNMTVRQGRTKTPYELFFGRKPNCMPLRVWGCRAYVLIEPHKRSSKVEPRAVVGRFVGYSQRHKGYRILQDDKNAQSVVESRNVVMLENIFDISETCDINVPTPDTSVSTLWEYDATDPEDFLTHPIYDTEDSDSDEDEDADIPSVNPSRESNGNDTTDISDDHLTTSIVLDELTVDSDLTSISDNDSDVSMYVDLSEEPDPNVPTVNNPAVDIDSNAPLLSLFTQTDVALQELTGGNQYLHDPNVAIFVVDEPTIEKAFASIQTPKNVHEALSGPDKHLWREALEKELNSLKGNCTWTLTRLPSDRKAIPCRWVLTIKYTDKGEIERYKARLVLQGFREIFGIDYHETFAPTGKLTTLRVLLALAAEHGWYDESYDVDTAFLHAELDEEIYMKQPPGFEDPQLKDYVCKLNKSIYGLKQAPRQWYKALAKVLTDSGLEVSPYDPCLFTKTMDNGYLAISVTVDDLKAFATSPDILSEFEQMLRQHFKIKKPNKEYHLGIHIHRVGMTQIHINQAQCVKDLLERFNMTDCRPVATPMDPGLELSSRDCPQTPDEKLKMKDKDYRALIGSLQYLSVATRPDITFAVSKLSRYLQNPGFKMWKAGLRVLQYLKGTIEFGITYQKNSATSITPYVDNGKAERTSSGVVPLCDADLAGDLDTRRSTTGFVILLSGGAISWGSKLQSVVSHSTTEAEYLAVDHLVREVVWLKSLLKHLKFSIDRPILLSDNNGCISISNNPSNHTRTKHIDIRYHYIRDQILMGEVGIKYISTDKMAADMFTKPLGRPKFEEHRTSIGMVLWTST